MYKYKELFDLSNFLVSSKYCCSNNKKVLGKIKDEYGGKSILKFVGLKSKMYSKRMKVIMNRSRAKVTMVLLSFKNFTIHYLRKRFLDTQ